jgi:hypothetical protein
VVATNSADDFLSWAVIRLLESGVPPTAIAKAFDIALEPVKELQAELRIDKYGTAELAEAMHNLIWLAIEDIQTIIATSPIDRRMRMDMNLISRASSIVQGQTPDSLAKMQAEMLELASEVAASDSTTEGGSIYEIGAVDAPVDDPEEGLDG